MVITLLRGFKTEKIEYTPPRSLTELLSGVQEHPCGGRGSCLKCRVFCSGELSPPDETELKALSPEELAAGIRLSCRVTALGNACVRLPEGKEADIVSDGDTPEIETDGESGLGAAVDLGTTTICAWICELESGRVVHRLACPNPQSSLGADVLSRISYALKNGGGLPAALAREAISRLLAPYKPAKTVIAGNTAMLYLLTARDPACLAAAPFETDCRFGFALPAGELGLSCPCALMPTVSAFVGADAAAAVLGTDLCRGDKPRLLMDVGTNGELALWDGKRLWFVSSPAGPAFEGAGIKHGMSAAAGAISRARLEKGLELTVIGGGKPAGICASGLISLAAQMLRAGVLAPDGLILKTGHAYTAHIISEGGVTAFSLGAGISFTQKDVRALQLAKAAMRGGAQALMAAAGVTAAELDELVLAGGFGSRLDIAAAAEIGLIPPIAAEKCRAVGNAALAGARLALLRKDFFARAQETAENAQVVSLSGDGVFAQQYIANMDFPR